MLEDISYRIQTFGCKVNTYDSGLLEKRFARAGYSLEQTQAPQVHVFNTCAVTAEATQEALRAIRRLKIKDPNSLIVVTGCAAQVDTAKFSDSQAVDLVVANSHKGELENLIRQRLEGRLHERVFKSNIFKKEDLEEGGGQEAAHTRAFLKIQDGCDSFCTFCVIPFARGKSRSLSIDALRERVDTLLSEGAREIVLTGVHIGDYEFGLENLIEDLLLRTRVPRLRLTSLEPIEISDRLLELFSDPRLCPHFHMSIQSATSSVLARMKRKYGAMEVEQSLLKIGQRAPNAFVGMDVIVGFPGEGEDEFLETYQRLTDLPWTRIHVFPYSERPGTYALKLDRKNTSQVIARRADRLRELSVVRYLATAEKQIGMVKKVLILKNESSSLKGNKGLSRDYWPVHFAGASPDSFNSEVKVMITGLAEPAQSRLESPLVGRQVF